MTERRRIPESLNSSIDVPESWIRNTVEKYEQAGEGLKTFDAFFILQGTLTRRLWKDREVVITANAQDDFIDVLINGEPVDMGDLKPNTRMLEVGLGLFMATCQMLDGRYLVDDLLAGGTLTLRISNREIPALLLNQC